MFNKITFYLIGYAVAILLGLVLFVLSGPINKKQSFAKDRLLLMISGSLVIVGIIGCLFLLTSIYDLAIVVLLVIVVSLLVFGIYYLLSEFLFTFLKPHIRSQQNALLWSLAIAVEKNIPLVPTVNAFASGSGWILRSKLLKLASLLQSGMPLESALHQVKGLVPKNALPMITIGHNSGALGKALRQAASTRDPLQARWDSISDSGIYFLNVIIFELGVITFIMIKIIPSFEKIFKDYNIDLPSITTSFIAISNFAVHYWYLFFLLILAFIFLKFLSYVFHRLDIFFPAFPKLMPKHTANIMDNLALATEAEQPLGKSLAILAECYPHVNIKYQLKAVGYDITRGMNWCDSLFHHKLIKQSDHSVLNAAQRVGNLPWAMRELATLNRNRLAYKIAIIEQLAYPPAILCIGLIVMFTVVALFYPVITLIWSLT